MKIHNNLHYKRVLSLLLLLACWSCTSLGESLIAETDFSIESLDEPLGTIASLFPDEQLAMFVRDETCKFSIEQTVTQRELDMITNAGFAAFTCKYKPKDLTGIHYLRNITYLSICYKKTTVLSDEICTLERLKTINFFDTDVTKLPEQIGDCKSLEVMYASSGIEEIPESFTRLANLKVLYLLDSKITTLPSDIGKLTSLEELYLSNSCIVALPETICDIATLRVLDVSNTNLTSLPERIGELANLRELDISYTKIKDLPESIYKLKLTKLDMAGTEIR